MRIVAFVCVLLFGCVAYGQGTASFAITSIGLGVPGDTVSCNVEINSSDPVSAFSFSVRARDMYLEPVSVTPLVSVEGWYPDMYFDGNPGNGFHSSIVSVGCIVDLDLTTVEVLAAGTFEVAEIEWIGHDHTYGGFEDDYEVLILFGSHSIDGGPVIINEVMHGLVSAQIVAMQAGTMLFSRGFQRGDANGDGQRTVGDILLILYRVFGLEPNGECLDADDVNDDSMLDISDATLLIDVLFNGGVAPDPSAICGFDQTPDGFATCQYNSCP